MIDRVNNHRSAGNFLVRCLLKTIPLVLVLMFLPPGIEAADPSGLPPASAQSSGSQDQGRGREADFLFSAPKGFLGFRIGRFFPRAESELFDMIMNELTLEKNDFRAWDFGVDGGADFHERLELVVSLDYLSRTKLSEFRDYVDEQDLPIVQETNYAQLPLTAGFKFLLIPRGRQVGQYAWLPSRFVPYLSAGGGVMWYRFEQEGDFVDFDTLEIFYAKLRSSGWTPTGYLGGGIDINIFSNTYLALDMRYSWAKPELGRDFLGFDNLDMTGLRATAGLQWHF